MTFKDAPLNKWFIIIWNDGVENSEYYYKLYYEANDTIRYYTTSEVNWISSKEAEKHEIRLLSSFEIAWMELK